MSVQRTELNADAVYTAVHAARMLPLDSEVAIEWLQREGLIINLMGRRLVHWGAVLDRLAELAGEKATHAQANWSRFPVAEV